MRRAPVPEMDWVTAIYTTPTSAYVRHSAASTYATLGQRGALCAVGEFGRKLGKVAQAGNGQVLLVALASQKLLGLQLVSARVLRARIWRRLAFLTLGRT